ncbi:glycosyltransferase family 32 protein, partial [Proteus mirabilis]
MIPKKIHYVWIGDKPKPKFVLECIDTWKKYLPDYQIIEWNNESIKDIKNNYMEEAIKNKKWAFASDYIRLHALYNEGGIYLDTDIEVTNSFNEFLELDFFTCHELYDNEVLPITSAVIGSKKNGDIIKDLLDIYMNIKFQNGTNLDLTPNTARITNYFKFKFNIQPPYN